MNQSENILFELNLPTGSVVFHQTSSWARFLEKQVDTPYGYQELMEQCIHRFVKQEYKESFLHLLSLSNLNRAYAQKQPLLTLEGQLLNMQTGAYEWYLLNLVISNEGQCFGTLRNIQEKKKREELLQYNASHDILTDLYNRDTFQKAVTAFIDKDVCCGAFFILDIDNFKAINDTTGHQQGDEVIVSLAHLLREQFPPNSVLGRFGGDEFTLFVPGGADPNEYQLLAESLCAAVARRWKRLCVTVSVGIALYPAQANSIDDLLSLADRALYYVKNNGKNSYAIFHPSMPELNARNRIAALAEKKQPWKQITVNWRKLGGAATALILLLALLGQLTHGYYTSLQETMQGESSEYLMEISRQISTGITNKLGTTLSYLEAMGDLLPHEDSTTIAELSSQMDEQCQKLGLDSLVAIDENGLEYRGNRPVYHAALQEHIARVLLDKESFMTDTLHIDGTDYVLFFVPIDTIEVEGIRISALVAFVDMENMNSMLSLTAFNNAAFAEIVNKNGAVVVRSGHPDSLLDGYNLFSHFERETFSKGYTLGKLQEDFKNGTNGVTRYKQGEREYVSYYSKLIGHNWMLFCTTPADILEAKSSAFIRITVIACTVVALLIAGLMSCILLLQVYSKRRLALVAYTDRVTHGANREKFVKDVQEFLTRTPQSSVMLYANIEHFKLINDRFGSEEADRLLHYIFQVFDNSLEGGEFVARIFGDHYAILLQDMSDHHLETRIRSWNRKISLFPSLQNAGFNITISYGIYRIEDNTASIDVLIDRANMARKNGTAHRGGSGIYFYDSSLHEAMQQEQELENTMKAALDAGEFQMYLQPKCLAVDGTVIGFEALTRWLRSDGTLTPPDHFIPFFEKNGFVIQLDHYIFEQACQVLARQLKEGISPAPISVNVSRAHLMAQDLLEPYIEIWKQYDIPAELLELEFTESTIYDNIEQLRQMVERIHQTGFTCSIDDFGAGYSSLNTLNLTNMDVVKIDRGFLGKGPDISERSRNIIQSIIQLSHKIGMQVVVEGVEFRQQADFLRSCGCDYFQGYYFAKPQPTEIALLYTEKILPEE